VKSVTRLAVLLICATWLPASGPHGTVPRATAWRYPGHTELNGVAMGAAVLSAHEAKQAFSTEVNRCCVVVEVAIYPEKGKPVDISLDDFALRTIGSDTATKPESAKVLAGNLQKKAEPSGRDLTVYPSIGIGVESGPRYDPATGESRRGGTGVYTTAGVGVGVGADPSHPRGASTDRDRDVMEIELSEKGVPEGAASAPVAGYLYFPLGSSKKKSAARELNYIVNGNKMTVRLP
jgi:hypothetical protein